MTLVDAFQSLLNKKKGEPQVFLSVFLDSRLVGASFWRPGPKGTVDPIATAHKVIDSEKWEDRITVLDELLGLLEDKTNVSDVTKTILGLSSVFLTATGEIQKEVRGEIKKLGNELALAIAGFVPLSQAIIYKLKSDEGVPPSVILLDISKTTIAVSLYKIGTLVGVRDIEKHDDVAAELEQCLKSFTEMEVLPARILLYGSDSGELEEVKKKLLHYQWTMKANFLHFPKIEILSIDAIVGAISLAGASEMKLDMPQEKGSEETITAEAAIPVKPEEKSEEEGETIEAQADAREEVAEAQEILREDFAVDAEAGEDANVVMVDAESLGFKKDADVLEEIVEQDTEQPKRKKLGISSIFSKIRQINFRGIQTKTLPVKTGVTVLMLILLGGLGYWLLPKATVTVLTVPQTLSASDTITIDPTATSVDPQERIVPGKSREQTVSGEKTVPVEGVKNVGDPARGTVTIYNKSLTTRTFKKGTVLSSGNIKFTLDSDVEVASASESVGSITFGKNDAGVTASVIGNQSNLPGGSEFSFADTPTSTAIARNDNAMTGGTSREVTVVSRTDVDNFVKNVSAELTTKAQEELATSVTGGEHMIEGTIKTTVKERIFDKEINQEATELHGKLTITVSGVTYSQEDIRSMLISSGSLVVPEGYTLDQRSASITLSDIEVARDGTITAAVAIEASALPSIDIGSLAGVLAGKSIDEAQTYLQTISGVGGMQVSVRFSPVKSRLPINRKNISVSISKVD